MRRILYIIIALFAGLSACQGPDYIEVKETREPIEQLIKSLVEFYSTYDILDDYASHNDLLGKKGEPLIPSSVKMIVTDSSFWDGDGISAILDFGELGAQEPYGVLCKDHKYRAGQILLELAMPYSTQIMELTVSFDPEHPFCSGDGTHMYTYSGDFFLKKNEEDDLSMQTEGLKITDSQGNYFKIACNTLVEKLDDPSKGILNDVVSMDGNFSIVDHEGRTFNAEVAKGLKKHYTTGCITNIREGELFFTLGHSGSDVSVDFDPYGDQACDSDVEITINGKSSIFIY